MRAVYLDHNATTPVRPEAVRAVADALAETGNPSATHAFGRRARARLEAARDAVAHLVGAKADRVTFTAGGTEANALALLGSGRPRLLVSAVEHESVLKARPDAEIVPVDADGVIDLDALKSMLAADRRPAQIALMLANNITGVLQPVAEAAKIAHQAGALLHCDAIQAAGKIVLDMPALGADTLALSAHKLGGPQGAGALVAAEGVSLAPLIQGGGQEGNLRSGTEPVPALAGFGAAAQAAQAQLGRWTDFAALRDRMEADIQALSPSAVIFAKNRPRLPNTSAIALRGERNDRLAMRLDLAGVMVSAGAACAAGKIAKGHVLAAMGVDPELAQGSLRLTLGYTTTLAEIEFFRSAWADLISGLANRHSSTKIDADAA
jgi:cysteine desulfurase